MLGFIGTVWIFVIFAGTCGRQIPLRASGDLERTPNDTHSIVWDIINSRPPADTTSNLLFDTVSSLLQHWPNTRYRNGHNIVPATVATGTLLYHGTSEHDIPTVPEWVATDPEHSYMFCRGSVAVGCWHLTLVTTRPLNLLYFDGSSAAKMLGGSMDSQDVLLWGEVRPDWTFKEIKRIKELCEWGKEFKLDGFVRMEMNFEIMLCDFTAGVEVVSFLNLASVGAHNRPHNQTDSRMTSAIDSGSRYNHYPGEPRILPDLTRLVSFYDTALVPSLVPLRRDQERYDHRLKGISHKDTKAIMKRLRHVLTDDNSSGSGVDWKALFRVIALRYTSNLELVQHLLNANSTEVSPLERAKQVQVQLRIMLRPYILRSAAPADIGAAGNYSWAAAVFEHCATAHTGFITSSPTFSSKLTPSEELLLQAVQDTNKEICRIVTKMWVDGVVDGLDSMLKPSSVLQSPEVVDYRLKTWQNDIEVLMAWLDWSIWVKCTPACGFEELCYLPTWPMIGRPPRELPLPPDDEDWLILKPKCIRRVQPYSL